MLLLLTYRPSTVTRMQETLSLNLTFLGGVSTPETRFVFITLPIFWDLKFGEYALHRVVAYHLSKQLVCEPSANTEDKRVQHVLTESENMTATHDPQGKKKVRHIPSSILSHFHLSLSRPQVCVNDRLGACNLNLLVILSIQATKSRLLSVHPKILRICRANITITCHSLERLKHTITPNSGFTLNTFLSLLTRGCL